VWPPLFFFNNEFIQWKIACIWKHGLKVPNFFVNTGTQILIWEQMNNYKFQTLNCSLILSLYLWLVPLWFCLRQSIVVPISAGMIWQYFKIIWHLVRFKSFDKYPEFSHIMKISRFTGLLYTHSSISYVIQNKYIYILYYINMTYRHTYKIIWNTTHCLTFIINKLNAYNVFLLSLYDVGSLRSYSHYCWLEYCRIMWF